MSRPITKLLIANRGEIAVRVARTCRDLGIASVGIAPPDDPSPHLQACDEGYLIDTGLLGVAAYLSADTVLEFAKLTGADAVHPGYGFLSERAEFAQACEAAGITWIGPSPDAIRVMGDKGASREAAIAAGVPTVPGTAALADAAQMRTEAERIGLPVMLKATAGGGGKGMRRIDDLAQLDDAIVSAQREAKAAFGDDRMLVEKLIEPARHVEIQILADTHGNVVALGERECSLQRRFQKVVEESPSTAVDDALRTRMGEAACALAKQVGYTNAGTVEFLLGPDGQFYFLEMNTRLQVEHPVTEAVMGVDLVALQLAVAQGEAIDVAELSAREPRGHAIEVRLYAENPEQGFLPASGDALLVRWPNGVRVDHALYSGGSASPHFDPMLAKIIAWAPNREHCRRKLIRALRDTAVLGFHHNLTWLIGLLETDAFVAGETFTGALPEVPLAEPPPQLWAAAANAAAPGGHAASGPAERAGNPFDELGGWRLGK